MRGLNPPPGRSHLPAGSATRWDQWHHPAVLVLALILAFPFGLVLLWTKAGWSVKAKGWSTAATGVLLLAAVLPSALGHGAKTVSTTAPRQVATASPEHFATSSPSVSLLPTRAPVVSPTAPVPTTPVPTTADPTTAIRRAATGSALALLGELAVKGRAPLTGYDRAAFGRAWADTDRNGCDTRNDILRRDLGNQSVKSGTNGCLVLSGDASPEKYTGKSVHFVYGGGSEIDIDHVVALGDAWQKGAGRWAGSERLAFANDPLNLLAVDASANRQKGDGDAATWLPANKSYRCAYVARQVSVKAKYQVWVTAAERDAIARVLSTCPAQPAPTGGNPTLAATAAATPTDAATTDAATTDAPTPSAAPTPSHSTALDPRFGTCKDAKAHGYGPYYEGTDPEFDWYRDADHDGIDCE